MHEEVRRAARRAKGSRPATLVHVVETDGRAFHATGRACERDRRRDRWLKLAGFEPIRFTWREVVEEPAMVLGAVRDLLARLARP